VTIVC